MRDKQKNTSGEEIFQPPKVNPLQTAIVIELLHVAVHRLHISIDTTCTFAMAATELFLYYCDHQCQDDRELVL